MSTGIFLSELFINIQRRNRELQYMKYPYKIHIYRKIPAILINNQVAFYLLRILNEVEPRIPINICIVVVGNWVSSISCIIQITFEIKLFA